ncbi:MAG: GAF domain-containing protein [Chloroflexi bacterium]|nr:GAF domain-containing protein [Chloroflexota bacterium]
MADTLLLPTRPTDATLTVTRAAQVLGVHPNTVRAWSDAGRLRYYRINPRGDRRYRLGDLQRFLASSVGVGVPSDPLEAPRASRRSASDPGQPAGDDFLVEVPSGAIVGAGQPSLPAQLASALGEVTATALRTAVTDADAPIAAAVQAIRAATGVLLVIAWRLVDDRLMPVGVAGSPRSRLVELPRTFGVLGEALDRAPAIVDAGSATAMTISLHQGRELACVIPGARGPWGVLLIVTRGTEPITAADEELIRVATAGLGQVVRASATAGEIAHQLHRAEALRRVAADVGSRLDLEQILAGVVSHAMVLFGGDRAAVFLFDPDGRRRVVAARGLSKAYQSAVEHLPGQGLGNTLAAAAVQARRPLFSVMYRDDPRAGEMREAIIQEGFDTACLAPLLDGDEPSALGALGVYHDRPHQWTDDELETIGALATQAAVAIKAARTYDQLATWAAQLQSIQQLGARLNRLTRVAEIGNAIATELRQLIDYHNVRVYRLYGEDLIPVAMQGQVGEYVDETPEMLRVKFGNGITGWVARERVAQYLPDAGSDPRANTIPGTDDQLDESMLLAPMLFEDEVLGVLVLSKLGLRQFQPDDLRLLVIYASFAAQAMANADATERLREQSAALERKVGAQRELLRLTESMLTKFDVRDLLETTVERLGDFVGSDNVAIALVDAKTGALTPQTALGTDAEWFLKPWTPGQTGLGPWVVEHNVPQLLLDEFDDARVAVRAGGRVHGSLICVPLRGPDHAIGVLTMERIGEGRTFTEDEFELVQLFAAQVSVGLQNAEVHQAVEQRAQTDVLTGLLNHGTFVDRMNRLIAATEPFSLVMLDLDRFKGVNDGFGHQAGDRLLRQVAESIVQASRETDAVFRYGGDEFAVLLPGTTKGEVQTIAERIRAAVATTVGPGTGWRGRARALEASAGTASFPDDGMTPEEVLLAADRACFVAKRAGGGRVASAAEGLAIAGELTLQTPTPIDPLPVAV